MPQGRGPHTGAQPDDGAGAQWFALCVLADGQEATWPAARRSECLNATIGQCRLKLVKCGVGEPLSIAER